MQVTSAQAQLLRYYLCLKTTFDNMVSDVTPDGSSITLGSISEMSGNCAGRRQASDMNIGWLSYVVEG